MDNEIRPVHRRRFATGLSQMDVKLLEYRARGMKNSEIAKLTGLNYQRICRRLHVANEKQAFLDSIHSKGEIWVGELPGMTDHCVGALERLGIITATDLYCADVYMIQHTRNIGRKGLLAIYSFWESREKIFFT